MIVCLVCDMQIVDDDGSRAVHRDAHLQRENTVSDTHLWDAMALDKFNQERLMKWEGYLRGWEKGLAQESVDLWAMALSWQQAALDVQARTELGGWWIRLGRLLRVFSR